MAAPKIILNANIIWPIVVLLIAAAFFYNKPWQTRVTETISVSSTGTAKATPNIAKITATIESKNPDIDAARRETETKASKIIEKLKAIGVEEKDIKTSNISGGQSYEITIYPPKTPTNQFQQSLEITIRDFAKADQVIAALTENGATNLYGPNLQVDDTELEAAKSKAREDAIKNAQTKAAELAKATKSKVGKVVSIKEQGDYALPVPLYARGGADLMEKASTIQPGQDEVSITLQVDFALK